MGNDDTNDKSGNSSNASSSNFHPAFGVNNIKNSIPLILDREKVQYSNWAELLECHAHAFNVLDHIDPKTPKPSDISEDMWTRLDSVVKNWIYDISSYCRELKNLKDQLANVDQPLSEQNLVIRLTSGLVNTDFDTVAAMIQQTEPLPLFETSRSRLLLEETRRANDNTDSPSSFVAQSTNGPFSPSTTAPPQQSQAQQVGRGGLLSGRGRGRGHGRGKGRGRGQA
ncbi:uncharacterized protein LOC110726632 [Chenopodium quinoa]|uniref:uncharacterized protein LOC110726632 n=1 Tax=Chenopodium quinoa TaxID=63459 RepID=UPI000B78EF63|nr:uncharacterized protein LOC110726632 [Chenopodium quinoa]